jgi:metallothionein
MDKEKTAMTKYAEGTVLTCTHEDCNCRVLIQAECHCPGVTDESAYRCACGAELVPAEAG